MSKELKSYSFKYDKIIIDVKKEIESIKKQIRNLDFENSPKKEQKENDCDNIDELFTNISNEIYAHFQKEVEIRQQIILCEDTIEFIKELLSLPNDDKAKIIINIKEKEYKKAMNYLKEKKFIKDKDNLYSKEKINKPLLQECITKIDKNIEQLYNEVYLLTNRRKLLQQRINDIKKLTDNNGNNSIYYGKLMNIYKYYIIYIENIISRHRITKTNLILQKKENEIKELTTQLDLRDKLIQKININNPKIINFDIKNSSNRRNRDLDNNSVLKIKSISAVNIFNEKLNNSSNTINRDFNSNIENNNSFNNGFSNRKVRIIKSFNKPLISRNKEDKLRNILVKPNYYNHLKYPSFIPKSRSINNSFKEIKYINNRNSNIDYHSILGSNKYMSTGNRSLPINNLTKNINENEQTLNSIKESNRPYIKKFENEIQQKVKILIRKNYIRRFDHSPYFDNFL